jgi:site-specific recombinase XerD
MWQRVQVPSRVHIKKATNSPQLLAFFHFTAHRAAFIGSGLGQNRNNMRTAKEFLDYIPAELREGTEWRVEYHVRHPDTNALTRMRSRVKAHPSVKERRRIGKAMASAINDQLAIGWNPFSHNEAKNAFLPFNEAAQTYLRAKKDLAEPTLQSYRSFIALASAFMMARHHKMLRVNQWDKAVAIDYLKWVRMERENTARTHNNHLMFFKGFWNWLLEYDLAYVHPFKDFKKLKVRLKSRTVVASDLRPKVFRYFAQKSPAMHLVCLLIFGAGIRRTELVKLRVRDVDLMQGCVHLDASETKTGDQRSPTLPAYLQQALEAYLSSAPPSSHFLISKTWQPGPLAIDPDRFTEAWERMRPKLDLPAAFQLYSLRDSGIEQLFLEGFDAKTIMHQYGHKSLSTTTKYAVRVNAQTVEDLKKSSGGL